MAGPVKPSTVGWDTIGRVEPQAAKRVRRDLAALLRRLGVQRMQGAKLRRQPLECPKLPRDVTHPMIPTMLRWIRIDCLPDAGTPVVRVLEQQPVQEGGAAARQPGNEDRAVDRLLQDGWGAPLLVVQAQQVAEKSHDVPPRRQPTYQ